MIERLRLCGGAAAVDAAPMQRQVVDARRQVDVVGVRLPFDGESQEIDVEALHLLEMLDVQREVAEAGVGWRWHWTTLQLRIEELGT